MHFWIQSYQVRLRKTFNLRSREIQYKSELPLNKIDESNMTYFYRYIKDFGNSNFICFVQTQRMQEFYTVVTVDPDIVFPIPGKTIWLQFLKQLPQEFGNSEFLIETDVLSINGRFYFSLKKYKQMG